VFDPCPSVALLFLIYPFGFCGGGDLVLFIFLNVSVDSIFTLPSTVLLLQPAMPKSTQVNIPDITMARMIVSPYRARSLPNLAAR
jgi:hypothetical protein